MTNGEFYETCMIKIEDDYGSAVAIINGKPKPCELKCEKCLRVVKAGDSKWCSNFKLIEWLCSEYVPPKPKLTKYEKAVLSLLEKGFMARDANKSLYFYENIPSRKRDEWCSNGGMCKRIGIDITGKAKFQFIKWQDRPISIEEMLTWEVEE